MDRRWAWLRCLMPGDVHRCLGRELRLDRLSMLEDLCRGNRSSALPWKDRTFSPDSEDLPSSDVAERSYWRLDVLSDGVEPGSSSRGRVGLEEELTSCLGCDLQRIRVLTEVHGGRGGPSCLTEMISRSFSSLRYVNSCKNLQPCADHAGGDDAAVQPPSTRWR